MSQPSQYYKWSNNPNITSTTLATGDISLIDRAGTSYKVDIQAAINASSGIQTITASNFTITIDNTDPLNPTISVAAITPNYIQDSGNPYTWIALGAGGTGQSYSLTPNKGVGAGTNGEPVSLTVSTAELNYSVGLTSNIQDQFATVVHLTGDETIDGLKTFTVFPQTPPGAPTQAYEVANMGYVDSGDYYKQNRDLSAIENNIAIMNADGASIDSGRQFDDSGTTTDDIWSADKIQTMLNGKQGYTFIPIHLSTNYTLLTNDSGKLITNKDATGSIIVSLPKANNLNRYYDFALYANHSISIATNSTDTIQDYSIISSSGGTITATTGGATLRLYEKGSSGWFVFSANGEWNTI